MRRKLKKFKLIFLVNYWNNPLILKVFGDIKEIMYTAANLIFCQNLLILARL